MRKKVASRGFYATPPTEEAEVTGGSGTGTVNTKIQ
jgi:hypothetical protein